jgi:hypothetical protein
MGKKIRRFVVALPRKSYRPSAKAIIVPNIVATTVAVMPTLKEFPKASQIPIGSQGFNQASSVKPRQTMFRLSASLKEKAIV